MALDLLCALVVEKPSEMALYAVFVKVTSCFQMICKCWCVWGQFLTRQDVPHRGSWTTWTTSHPSRFENSSNFSANWRLGSSSKGRTSRCKVTHSGCKKTNLPSVFVLLLFSFSLTAGRHAHSDPQAALQHCAQIQANRHHWRCDDCRQHGSS